MKKSLLLLSSLSLLLTACDNRNETKEHKNSELTGMPRSETEADRALAQKIHETIAADNAASIDLKRIKVVVINGVVTLRGTVRNDNEKNELTGKVKAISGVKSVDNQLEISRA